MKPARMSWSAVVVSEILLVGGLMSALAGIAPSITIPFWGGEPSFTIGHAALVALGVACVLSIPVAIAWRSGRPRFLVSGALGLAAATAGGVLGAVALQPITSDTLPAAVFSLGSAAAVAAPAGSRAMHVRRGIVVFAATAASLAAVRGRVFDASGLLVLPVMAAADRLGH